MKNHDALPAGTRFGEFEIIRVLGVGGFGIVYLAQDHSLERQVALKEYMPAALAARGAGPMLTVRAGAFAETFHAGLRSFINEARLLARFDHPSLVKVYRFWEDNGTAYMVMPYLQGRTLRDARRAMGRPPDEAWIRSVLDPLLDALEQLHLEGVFHRDIAPDNILLPPGALPILLDFGAARRVIADRTQSLTSIVKPSYAPIEQYAEMATMRQGPWTDLYALGAVLHYLLFGVPPAPATARAVQPELDRNEPIEQRVVAGVSPRFLSIVRWMLGVRPLERPQSVAALRAALNGQLPVPADLGDAVTVPSVAALHPAAPTPSTGAAPANEAPPPARSTVAGSAPLRSTPPGTLPPTHVPTARPVTAPAAAPVAMSSPAHERTTLDDPGKPRRGWALAGGVAAAVVAVGVLWQFIGVVSGPRSSAPSSSAASGADQPGWEAAVARSLTPVEKGLLKGSVAAASAATVATVAPAAPAPLTTTLPPEAPEAPIASMASMAPSASVVPIAVPASAPAAASRARARSAPVTRTAPAALRDRVARGPTTAAHACSGRNFFSRAVCMDRECERPRFRGAAECVKVLEIKRRRTAEH